MGSSWLNWSWQRASVGTNSRKSLSRREQDCLREVIREAREEAGLSRRELSLKLKMPAHAIAKVERGLRLLDVVELIDIAEAVGRDPAELLADVLARR